jgi:hypothetical protein
VTTKTRQANSWVRIVITLLAKIEMDGGPKMLRSMIKTQENDSSAAHRPTPPKEESTFNRIKSVDYSSHSHLLSDSVQTSQSLHISHLEVTTKTSDIRGFRTLALTAAEEEDNIPCQRFLHDNLRSLWYCQEFQRKVCYCCSEMLTDSGYVLTGGLPELYSAEDWIGMQSESDLLYQLNSGQEMILNLALLRCPCGTPFQHSTQSAICSMCCNATCSATCHKQLVQDVGMCFYHLNFLPAARSEVHGCRDVRWCIIERSPPGTYLSRVCGPRYLEAITGTDPNMLLVRRGYGQYGQPLQSTLDALTPLPASAQRPRSVYRRNLCRCSLCRAHQPHAVLHRRCRRDPDVPVDDSQGLGGLPAEHPLSPSYRAAAAAAASQATTGGGRRGGSRAGGSRRSTMMSGASGEGMAATRTASTAAASRSRGSGQSRTGGSEALPDIAARTAAKSASGSLGSTGWAQQSRKVRPPAGHARRGRGGCRVPVRSHVSRRDTHLCPYAAQTCVPLRRARVCARRMQTLVSGRLPDPPWTD